MIGDPPSDSGATHDTTADEGPGFADTPNGSDGTPPAACAAVGSPAIATAATTTDSATILRARPRNGTRDTQRLISAIVTSPGTTHATRPARDPPEVAPPSQGVRTGPGRRRRNAGTGAGRRCNRRCTCARSDRSGTRPPSRHDCAATTPTVPRTRSPCP